MATYYLDPIGGNDANPGTSFAGRKKTIASLGALAAGDTVRFIESRAAYSLGSATWTDNSATVTLATGKTLTISNSTAAWTASANVTCSTTTERKIGATAAQFAIAPGFTTGKAAYFTLPGKLNLSGYEAVSFWLRASTVSSLNLNGGQLVLNLCSDTTGAVVVNAIAVNISASGLALGANTYIPVVIDTGAALGSAIASISISFTADPATPTFLINNIVACKSKTHANHLSHLCGIGKNTSGEPEWYPIRSISDTTLTVGTMLANLASPRVLYRGTSESVTTYALLPMCPRWTQAAALNSSDGTIDSYITYSGGWNSTSMSTQSGQTWLSVENYISVSNPFNHGNSSLYRRIEGFGIAHTAFIFGGGGHTGYSINLLGVFGCNGFAPFAGSSEQQSLSVSGAVCFLDGTLDIGDSAEVTSCFVNKVTGTSSNGVLLGGGNLINRPRDAFVIINSINNCIGFGLNASGLSQYRVQGITFTHCTSGPFQDDGAGLSLENCTFSTGATEPALVTALGRNVRLTAIGGDSTQYGSTGWGWRVRSQSAVRHTASGVALGVRPLSTSACNVLRPGYTSLAKFAVAASALVTFKAWVRRSNTGLTLGLRLVPRQLPGITGGSALLVPMTAGADTWEELTLTFTPTATGVVEVEGYFYGGTTFDGYYDDITITQA